MTTPAWPPRTEEQLERAARNGLLIENHTLDIKRELTKGESGNKEIAKDIAAFSVDGGLVIIGVDEDQKPPQLTPVPLTDLSERIEQVGLARVDETVTVSTTEIPSKANPDEGYLLVEVPISPRPPHMADNKYYERGDKTNHPLSNAEVLRYHERLISAGQRHH
jgi:predicted HTH transcriptional regulator